MQNEDLYRLSASICGIPYQAAALNQSSNLSIASFVGKSADPADLKKLLGGFRPGVNNKTTFGVKGPVYSGSSNRVKATTEASLDVQYTASVATGIETPFVSLTSNNSDGIAGFQGVIKDLIAQEELQYHSCLPPVRV